MKVLAFTEDTGNPFFPTPIHLRVTNPKEAILAAPPFQHDGAVSDITQTYFEFPHSDGAVAPFQVPKTTRIVIIYGGMSQ